MALVQILPFLIPLTALFIPIYIVKRRYDFKEAERRHQLAAGGGHEELASLREERKLLQARIENLESIVCSVDYELNMRIAKLATSSEGAPARPSAAQPAAEPAEAAEAAAQALGVTASRAAGPAHAGVIHRDLKPQNVLVGERSALKIIDFGLAKTTFLGQMTATGLILGTPQYMSPEQIQGRAVDARSDIYSLGALAYHTVAGAPPFGGETPIAVTFAACTQEPADPRSLRPEVPARLADGILAALSKEPARRPQTVEAFRAAL